MIHEPLPHPNEPAFIAEVTYSTVNPGSFVPTARVLIGHGIAELARDIGIEEVGFLAVLMQFVTANGAVGPSAAAISAALGTPTVLLRLRLHRLARRYWRGQPVLRAVKASSGLETFHPSPIVLGYREVHLPTAALPSAAPAAARERVIEASRNTYARPREEVERELRSSQGWPHPEELQALSDTLLKPPVDLDERWVVERLSKEKVDYALALKLVKEFGAERCLKQLKALPYRKGIKNTSRYLVGAIQGDYAIPQDEEGTDGDIH